MTCFEIRPINASNSAEIHLIAQRMRLTLMEVVGRKRGSTMFTMGWLRDRVRWHLDPEQCTGAVFVAEKNGEVVGHTIVRRDVDESSRPMGLFSTSYVEPGLRRQGLADALIIRGEGWMRKQSLERAATRTSAANEPLIRLYEKHGYAILQHLEDDMILLGKELES